MKPKKIGYYVEMQSYDHKRVEKKWQKIWAVRGDFKAKDSSSKKKFYALIEFPYPSGDGLHVGHPRPYIGMDIIARKRRREGYNVLYPIGWDAFGLPTENYAIKTGIHPRVVTARNTKNFRRQIQSLAISFDWSREINTTDPSYYRWTQWLFLQFFKKGLAYKKKMPINWCLSCKIGLANEEVIDGKCERCGGATEKREKEQWMLAITKYADRLHKDLDTVDFAERIKLQQRNWIGRSEGVTLKFRVENLPLEFEMYDSIPQTHMAQTFTVIAPDHPLLYELVKGTQHEQRVMEKTKEIILKREKGRYESIDEMDGIFTGRYLEYTPAGRKLPIWVASFVVADYGTGVVNCSFHDERDYKFAKKFNIPLHPVLFPKDPVLAEKVRNQEVYYREPDGILEEPAAFKGRRWDEAREDIIEYLVTNGWARRTVNYKLRDWVFSRQRYWGEPMPVVFCIDCKKRLEASNFQFPISVEISRTQNFKAGDYTYSIGEVLNPGWVAVPDRQLPIKLPRVSNYKPTDNAESPLAAVSSWVTTTCPKCKGPAKRETDTMPNWAGSSWYYLRYLDPNNSKQFAGKRRLSYWSGMAGNLQSVTDNIQLKSGPVDWYNGGMEHTTLHLLYSRFWHKFLFDLKLVPTSEPYAKRTSHGLILAEGGAKMSKSKGNVINPDRIVSVYGADALRMYEMFMGPFEQAIGWNTESLIGMRRFLERVWRLGSQGKDSGFKKSNTETSDSPLLTLMHQTIKKVGDDIEAMKFNTAVSHLMVFSNALLDRGEGKVPLSTYETLLKLLAPFAPHLSEELWFQLGRKKSIHAEPWPTYDSSKLLGAFLTIVVQINGKVRGSFTASRETGEEALKKQALELPETQKWIAGKEVKKVFVIQNRLINIVVGT